MMKKNNKFSDKNQSLPGFGDFFFARIHELSHWHTGLTDDGLTAFDNEDLEEGTCISIEQDVTQSNLDEEIQIDGDTAAPSMTE